LFAAFGTQTPFIAGGKSVAPPAIAMSIDDHEPSISSGAAALPDAIAGAFSPEAPRIVQSATVTVPGLDNALEPLPTAAEGGATIHWESQEVSNTYGGSIAEGSIGEFAIGEGYPQVHIKSSIPDMAFMTPRPAVASGGSATAPAVTMNDVPQTPEIGARRRKLRVQGIAS
jgi:hypothetical protein